MISSILVPTDFSDVANNALHFALKFSEKMQAKVHVLHVTHIPVIDASFPGEVYQEFISEIEETARHNFQKLEQNYLQGSGVRYETHTIMGFVNDEVHEFARHHAIDLIIMGTTGASGLQEVLVGSNAASVVGKSHIPVLVIPPSGAYHEMKHIVYASDFNEPEFPAVSRLIYVAERFGAHISILHVKSDFDRFFDSAHNFFTRNKDHISYDKWKVVKLPEGDVMDKINEFIIQENADMLVMAKHNRSFFDRIFHRSLSKRMTYHTQIPLLVLNK
jgi:nucleotide-binding universal stress UspA family protein